MPPLHSIRARSLMLALCLSAGALAPMQSRASVACLQSDWGSQVQGMGSTVSHPSILSGTNVYAGTFHALIDNVTPVELYCVDINHYLCFPACYSQGSDISSPEIIWVLNHYYPTIASEPSALGSVQERASAVQLALWHFSDGVDISSGGSPSAIFDAARAIVAAASAGAVAATPTAIGVNPASSVHTPGNTATVTATVRDQNTAIMAGVTVSWEVTGANPTSGSGVTDSNGEIAVSWNGVSTGDDQLALHVAYTLPVGVHWLHDGCQSLIMGSSTGGQLTQIALVSWQPSTAVRATTWGAIKSTFATR